MDLILTRICEIEKSCYALTCMQVVCDNKINLLFLQAELMWGSMDEEVKTTYGKSYFDQKVKTEIKLCNTVICFFRLQS